MVSFPAPVGGTAYPIDFAPSVLFAVLYAALLPLMLYRMFDRRSRTALLIGTVTFSIERVVIFSLRASQAHNEHRRLSPGLATYMQVSFGMGFLGIANDLVNLLRCLIVNPTYGSAMYFQSPAATTKGGVYSPPPPGTPDRPKLRFWCRRTAGFLGLAFLAATVPGLIANSNYSKDFNDQGAANQTATLRYVSTGVTLALCKTIIAVGAWSSAKFPKNSKRAAGVLCGVAGLMSVVAIYRLSIMHFKTTSLAAPSSLNDTGAKVAFYILHVLPEWLAITILLVANIRKLFGAGIAGDFRWHDMTTKELAKWEARQAKKEEKRKMKLGISGDSTLDAIPLQEKTKNSEGQAREVV